jgi:predicted nuclease of predicted toxin-antitoxin system
VNFLVDAQLPRKLADLLRSLGHDAVHTLDLPKGNSTSDGALCELAANDNRILITKDADFVDSFFLRDLPPKLLFVTTGNIQNQELLALFEIHHSPILEALSVHSFIEVDRSGLTIHD